MVEHRKWLWGKSAQARDPGPSWYRQGGWTLWSLGLVLALIIFFALLLFKLIPPYLDDQKIQKALNSVIQEQHVEQMSRRAIVSRLSNILYIDFALDLVDIKKDLKITKNNNILKLAIDYEVVIPMAYNISALLTFSDRAEMPMKVP
ncbi:MAG TPA: DUF4845 domain-containing protein [Gammaproteobacteria bacterium]|nr:DUF4845 domain-containing protein [Gammaproteobacteria bacterium]